MSFKTVSKNMYKKVVFLIAIITSMCSMAQNDTLGRYPYLYTYGMPESNCVIIPVPYMAGDSAGDEFASTFNDVLVRKVAFKMHADDTIHIVGIAFSAYVNTDRCRNLSIYDTVLEPIESVITLPTSGITCFNYYQPLSADEKCIICPGVANDGLIFRYAFFPDSSIVDVVGDFYIGGYAYRTASTDDDSPICTPFFNFFTEQHDPPYHFPERHFKVYLSNSKKWEDYISLKTYPLIFPIIEIPCPAVDNVYLVDTLDTVSGVRTLSATWDSIRYQSLWVVTVTDESGALVLSDTVTTRSWNRQGFEHDVQYTVSVQSRCDSPRPTWSAQRRAGIVQQATTQDMSGISVHPNPASNKAVLHFGEPMPYGSTLEVCDQGGRRLSVHKPQAGSLSMELSTEFLAAGTYLLRLTTPQWTAMGKLVVVH